MWVKRRHRFITNLIRSFLKFYCRIRYKCHVDKAVKYDDNFIAVCNHVTSFDQFMFPMLFKNIIYQMATADLFDRPFFGKLIKFLVNPIPKEKNKKSDLKAIKTCINVIKENGSVGIFVEGNRTFSGDLCYVDDSIAKLVKLLKKPLIICNIEGGYGIDPRWGRKLRNGKMHVSIKKRYEYDEIKDMTNEELFNLIKKGITVNNFHNPDIEFTTKTGAEYLERVVYICPKCGKIHTLYSKGNNLYCSNCDLIVKYNFDLTLTSNWNSFNFKHVNDWYNYQLDYVRKSSFENEELIYEDVAILGLSRKFKSRKKLGKGKFRLYGNRFEFITKTRKFIFDLKDVESCTILGRKKMGIYYDDKTYQIYGNKKMNLLKYMHMYYFMKNKEGDFKNEFWGI